MCVNTNKKVSSAKIAIIVLSVLLCISIAALVLVLVNGRTGISTSKTSDNIITDQQSSEKSGSFPAVIQNKIGMLPLAAKASPSDTTVISFSTENYESSVPFTAQNMFPGDAVTKTFEIDVAHKNSVTLNFTADVREGYEKLAEVLKAKISDPVSGEALFDGLMKDVPDALQKELAGKNSTDKVYYEITAYLSTSVGNDYMNKSLIADFKWWVAEEDVSNLDKPPKTFDSAAVFVAGGLLVVSTAAIIILKRCRKEKEEVTEND